ncbi:hypothetical protein GCM10009737_11270 [Nocardioides lentus]|uniref:YfhO family protein n=1 Tax=Nocardioides lentus TaxID=338077 RepID=A0ABN2P3H6_9ACTN
MAPACPARPARLPGDLPPALLAALLVALLLGPALGPGYVLSYDMVWVPQLTMRGDFLGLGSALPRAVPSDAVVAALDLVVPGVLLQKLALAGSLVAGAVGAARLAPDVLAARLWAAALWAWNPFVVERLVIGHWPVLVGYAVAPWVLLAVRARRAGGSAPRLWPLLVLGSLSASAGVVTGVLALALGLRLRRGRWRDDARLVLGVGAANLPWIVPGLLSAAAATGGAASTVPFAASGAAGLPAPVVLLGLGGVWNVDAAAPRGTSAVLVALAVLAVLAAAGARSWWRTTGRREGLALAGCWVVGLGVALVGWAAPGVLAAVAALPGGGLLRDGARSLTLCAPLLVAVTSSGVAVLVGTRRRAERVGWTMAAALAPVALLPGAAWGVGGRLEAVDYPPTWESAREAVLASPVVGDVLVLPLSAYRAPSWNDGRPVLDPLGRFLPRDHVTADDLVVSGEVVPGEDPRVDEVAAALAAPGSQGRAGALAELGIGLVVTDPTAAGPAPEVAGEVVHASSDLEVVALPGVLERSVPASRAVGVGVAWAAWWACLLAGPAGALASRRRRRRRRRPTTRAAPSSG